MKSSREARPGAIGHTRVQGKTLGTPIQSYGKYDPIFEAMSLRCCTEIQNDMHHGAK